MSFAVTPPDSTTYWTSLLMVWTILFFLIRMYIRFAITRPLGHDDTALALGTLVSIGQSSVTLWAVQQGLGKREELLSSSQIVKVLKSTYTASLLYIPAISASKCSMSLFILRFTTIKYHRIACKAVMYFTIVWGIVSMFVIAFQCDMPQPWDATLKGHCSSLFLHWVVIEAFSGFIEVALFALPICLVWSLHVPFKSKVLVIGAFSCRLLTIIPLTFRLHYLRKTSDANFSVTTTIMIQVAMHSCLMAATVPCVRIFLSTFNSWMGSGLELQSPERNQGSSWSYTVSSSRYTQDCSSTQELDRSNNQATTRSRNQDTEYLGCDPRIEARSIESNTLNTRIIRKTGNWPLVDGSPAHNTGGSEVQIFEAC